MSRVLLPIAILAVWPLACGAATSDAQAGPCQIAAAQMHSAKGRLLRRRAARIGQREVESVTVEKAAELVPTNEAGPTVVQGASPATLHLPARDTEVWPPAWGLFPPRD